MKQNILTISLIIFVYGCSVNEQNIDKIILEKFPVTDTLKSEKIGVPVLMLDPRRMQISDSILIVLQPKGKIKFEFFLLPECKYLKGYGVDGKGPEDFTHIATGTFTVSTNNKLVLIDRRNRIRFFNLNNIQTDNWHPVNSFSMPREITPTFQMVYNGDSIIYGHARNETLNAEVYSYNIHTQEVSTLIHYPKIYPGMSSYDKSRVFIHGLGLKPDGSKLVSAYYYFKKIRIYDITTGHSIEVVYKDAPKPEDISTIKKTIRGYYITHFITFFMGDLRTTNKYIYVEMVNKKIEDLDPSALNNETEIHIFDWEGNPVARCIFDELFDCYAISPDDEFLYAASSADEGFIKRYKLKEVLNK